VFLGRRRALRRGAYGLTGCAAIGVIALLIAQLLAAPGAAAPSAGSLSIGGPDPAAATRIALKPGPADAVLTARGDLTRLGLDNAEPELSQAALASGRFGKRVGYPVDGKIYAQPLYVPGLRIDGGVHNVVIVATEHDSVYAFDADATSAVAPLWHVSLLQPGARTFQAASDRVAKNRLCNSIVPEVGITSTPVIDWATQTIYVMALDVEHGVMTYRLHALALATGTDTRPSTVVSASVSGSGLDSVNGAVAFQATEEQQRMALTEVNGVVYAGFASWCGWAPYHGWVLGFSTSTTRAGDRVQHLAEQLGRRAVGVRERDHRGRARPPLPGDRQRPVRPEPAAAPTRATRCSRSSPSTARCTSSTTSPPSTSSAAPSTTRTSAPARRWSCRANTSSYSPRRQGPYTSCREASLGKYHSISAPCNQKTEQRTDVDTIKQELSFNTVQGGMWGTWAYWSQGAATSYVYGSGSTSRLTQYRLEPGGAIDPTPVAEAPLAFAYPGAIPVVTGDDGRPGSGVVWTVDQTHGATLRAFAADDVSKQLWNSAADKAGTASIRASSTTSPCRPPRTAW
jgi:hypothetical protein